MKRLAYAALAVGTLVMLGALVWMAVTAAGNPDPAAADLSLGAVVVSTGLIVFREGLEAILVVAALTASLATSDRDFRRPITYGAGAALLASIVTWFVVVAIVEAVNAPQLHVQAATGLIAIVVLLVIMNWFFHKVYWTGWISAHNRRQQLLLSRADDGDGSGVMLGMALLGFSAVYREGFEVVIFLQNFRIQAGTGVVLEGVAIGLVFTAVAGVLTFIAHRRLPYKKMLVVTGVMLAGVLLVMVGGSVKAMQLAGWISATPVGFSIPGWITLWFSVFPTVECLVAQGLAALLVGGSYFVSRYLKVWRPSRRSKHKAPTPQSVRPQSVSPQSVGASREYSAE